MAKHITSLFIAKGLANKEIEDALEEIRDLINSEVLRVLKLDGNRFMINLENYKELISNNTKIKGILTKEITDAGFIVQAINNYSVVFNLPPVEKLSTSKVPLK